MKFTAKTETLRKVVEVLEEIRAEEIDGFTSNDAQDLGEVLLTQALAMKRERAEAKADKERMREDLEEISQAKPLKRGG